MILAKQVAIGLGLTGFVFIVQGLGLTDFVRSAMNHDIRWTWVGIGLIIVALFLWQRKP
jgi:hypothetical protein